MRKKKTESFMGFFASYLVLTVVAIFWARYLVGLSRRFQNPELDFFLVMVFAMFCLIVLLLGCQRIRALAYRLRWQGWLIVGTGLLGIVLALIMLARNLSFLF